MPRSNVVITGLGVVSSIGIGADAYFQALLAKRSGVRSLSERTDNEARPTSPDTKDGFWVGGPILDFDPKRYVRPRKSLKVMCREIQTAYASSQLAVTDAGLEHLKTLSSLTFLCLGVTDITDAGLVHLEALSKLEELGIGGTQVTDAGLVHLKTLSSLTLLDLGAPRVTDEGVKKLQQALPNCKILH